MDRKKEKNQFHMQNFITQRDLIDGKRQIVKSFKNNFSEHKFCQKDVRGNTGCVNSLKFSTNEKLLASGGDDTIVRIWTVDEMMMRRAPKPRGIMDCQHSSNIFSLAFDLEDRFIYSGERAGEVYKHDIETKQLVFSSAKHRFAEDVFHLHQNPMDNNLLAITRCHMVSIFDNRDRPNPTIFREGAKFYSAEFHPLTPRLFLVNSRKEGPNVYDLRAPGNALFKLDDFHGFPATTGRSKSEWMAGMWSPSGNQYFSLRNNAQPLYFDLLSRRCFILNSANYTNVNTVKSMTFIDDRHVATGSDNWGIHVWRTPRGDEGFQEVTHEGHTDLVVNQEVAVLKGHRSIPNQVTYSPMNNVLASSGVENIVKLWSDCTLPWSYDVPFERKTIFRYSSTRPEEIQREREERRILEDALDRDGALEGRATWQDVFGGDPDTGEDRNTLEQFDTMEQMDVEELESDEESQAREMRRRMMLHYGEVTDDEMSSDDDGGPILQMDRRERVEIHDNERGAFRVLAAAREPPPEPIAVFRVRDPRTPPFDRIEIRAPLMGSPNSSSGSSVDENNTDEEDEDEEEEEEDSDENEN